jgi:hypothetical protein
MHIGIVFAPFKERKKTTISCKPVLTKHPVTFLSIFYPVILSKISVNGYAYCLFNRWQCNEEFAAFARFGFKPYLTAHTVDNTCNNSKAQTFAFNVRFGV